MHHCAYDATGDKQWHDLANKRFEVVGHNGMTVRSTESAPPPSSGTPPLPVPASPRVFTSDADPGGGVYGRDR